MAVERGMAVRVGPERRWRQMTDECIEGRDEGGGEEGSFMLVPWLIHLS